jgi:hypothetical protein
MHCYRPRVYRNGAIAQQIEAGTFPLRWSWATAGYIGIATTSPIEAATWIVEAWALGLNVSYDPPPKRPKPPKPPKRPKKVRHHPRTPNAG